MGMYDRIYGDKYDKSLNTKDIAKRVRTEIKELISEGVLPEIKVSIRTDFSHIRVEIKDIKANEYFLNKNRLMEEVRREERGENAYNIDHWQFPIYSEYGKNILKTIESLLDAYNHDGSDSMSDYYDVNFYKTVCFDYELEKAQKSIILEEIRGDKPASVVSEPVVTVESALDELLSEVEEREIMTNVLPILPIVKTNQTVLNAAVQSQVVNDHMRASLLNFYHSHKHMIKCGVEVTPSSLELMSEIEKQYGVVSIVVPLE